jgi:hypothetical protein
LVLAHAGLATTDMALTACLTASFFAMILWAEDPSWKHTAIFGVASGLALLSKFTALGYLSAAAALSLVVYLAIERPGVARLMELARARAGKLGVAMAIGAFTIWAGYLFSFGKIPGTNVSVPAPEWFDGIVSASSHLVGGGASYFWGTVSEKARISYFPVALAVKTPLAYLLLLVLGVVLCLRRRTTVALLPLAFSFAILALAMMGNVNLGVRHILPVYCGFSIAAAVALVQLGEWSSAKKWAGPAALLALLWFVGTGVVHHPYYLAYFNELAGSEPEKILIDSDLDWNQDYVEVAEKLRSMGVTEVNMGRAPELEPYLQIWPGLPKVLPLRPLVPVAGWAVVSITADKLTQYGLMHRYPNLTPWWDALTPVQRVGSTLFYYVPPGSIRLRQAPPSEPRP